MSNVFPKLHNAMWPGLVGKGSPGAEPFISLDRMLELTTQAEVNGQKFDGVDLFLFDPHINIDLSDDDVKRISDKIASKGLAVGSVVAPVWPGTVGDSAMGGPATCQVCACGEEGLPDRRDLQQAWRSSVRRHPSGLGHVSNRVA